MYYTYKTEWKYKLLEMSSLRYFVAYNANSTVSKTWGDIHQSLKTRTYVALKLELLNIQRLFDLNCLKFVYRFKKGSLPCYFFTFDCIPRSDIHDHDTRYSHLINIEATRTRMAENCIRHNLITIVNNTPRCILDKIDTHSLEGFSFFIKRHYLNELTYECNLMECYVCGNWTYWITATI